ncbi:MAG: hypothetical protein ACTHK2_04570 [Dokdonella sp.]
MTKKKQTGFMRQFALARRDIALLEKLFPGSTRMTTLTRPKKGDAQ